MRISDWSSDVCSSDLYGGIATPSEAAGVGAMFCILLVVVIYGLVLRSWQPRRVLQIVTESTRESVMILMFVGSSEPFAYPLSSIFVPQSVAEIGTASCRERVGQYG